MEKEQEIWEAIKKMLAKSKKSLYISISGNQKINFIEEVKKIWEQRQAKY